MKKFTLFMLVILPLLFSAQKNYKKIPESQISQERKNIALQFVNSYTGKCKSHNYTPFEGFNITGRLKHFLATNYEKNCGFLNSKYGNVSVEDFQAAYLNRYSLTRDPVEMFIFRITTEKNPEIRFANVWIYRDQNFVGGIYFSKEPYIERKYLN